MIVTAATQISNDGRWCGSGLWNETRSVSPPPPTRVLCCRCEYSRLGYSCPSTTHPLIDPPLRVLDSHDPRGCSHYRDLHDLMKSKTKRTSGNKRQRTKDPRNSNPPTTANRDHRLARRTRRLARHRYTSPVPKSARQTPHRSSSAHHHHQNQRDHRTG